MDVRFKLFLDTESLSLCSRFSFKRSLHGVHCSLVVLSSIVKLLFLFLDLPINLLTNLSKFQLSSENLVFFLFQSSFSLLKSSLKFFLLNFMTAALFIKFMNRTSTITQLVKKIFDLISKILVLTFYNIQLLSSFIPSSFKAEEFTVIITAFLLAGLNFSCQVINFGFPFTNNLVKVSTTFFCNNSSSMNSFIFKLQVLKLSFKTMFGLFSTCHFLVQAFNGFFSFKESGRQFLLSTFKFINTSKSFSLKFRPP